ncbi:MAG: enoyl-CoA hydratase/isomerase family protein [Ruminococcus sp.]|uniref:enoyl-CoA hydratase/isomerase family protein n=1 Tax=Ruminococcus sp. TaxID=41978 RepID=UPI00260111E0|nr:enoyl-CoA hydratase/isomerase family protein [Ruminococcus sp.]MCR4795461.1 enoyl-CoA hydratase/isomerase family protein [Ruminococcus sp.]
MNENNGMILEEQDGILILSMNMPGNNLMTADFFKEYEAVMADIEERAAKGIYKGLIIKGAGRHFSVGADVDALSDRSANETYDDSTGILPEGHIRQKHFFTFLRKLPFPVISVVTGFCIGSGSEIAVNSHYRIIEKNARVGQPESTFGILPALGGVARTIEICGTQNAYTMVMSGELIPSEEAFELGWADIFAEKKQGTAEAMALIKYISEKCENFAPDNYRAYMTSYLQSKEA